MKHKSVVIIGGGNMGTAVLRSLLLVSGVQKKNVTVIERNNKSCKSITSRFGVKSVSTLASFVLAKSDVVLVAVKPQDFPAIAKDIRAYMRRDALLVSIMAGITCSTLKFSTGCRNIVRVMPNLPMIVGKGFAVWFALRTVNTNQKNFIQKLFGMGGEQMQIRNEKIFDAVTAVSGSGPAYVFLFITDLIRAAVDLGLSHTISKAMVLGVIDGALALLRSSNTSPEEWRDRVTSKRGTTEAAFKIIKKSNMSAVWLQAIRAAAKRSSTISTTLDKMLSIEHFV